MSNYPDNFDASAHDARYAQADCLVDDWHKGPDATALIKLGARLTLQGNDGGYCSTCDALDAIREQAFDDCTCGRCGDSNNFATDGESLINDAMVSA